MSTDMREDYADLAALVEELESSYGRRLLKTFPLERLLVARPGTPEIIMRTIREEVLKAFHLQTAEDRT